MQNEEGILAVGTVATESPIDWGARDKDLSCPLCGYNLRGLTEPRCPECGFAFQWHELLDAEKNRHPYLFEYGQKRNIKTFWATYWSTCRPRRFWREINPAQEVRWLRLLLYWLVSSCLFTCVFSNAYVSAAWREAYNMVQIRVEEQGYLTSFPGGFHNLAPLPWQAGFWSQVFTRVNGGRYRVMISSVIYSNPRAMPFEIGLIYLAWPGLTLLALLIFRLSMRKARIKNIHVVRVAIYSCDFSFLMLALLFSIPLMAHYEGTGWLLMATATSFAMITSYRLTIACNQYLRLHLPLATVLASQVIALLMVFVALVPFADFTGKP